MTPLGESGGVPSLTRPCIDIGFWCRASPKEQPQKSVEEGNEMEGEDAMEGETDSDQYTRRPPLPGWIPIPSSSPCDDKGSYSGDEGSCSDDEGSCPDGVVSQTSQMNPGSATAGESLSQAEGGRRNLATVVARKTVSDHVPKRNMGIVAARKSIHALGRVRRRRKRKAPSASHEVPVEAATPPAQDSLNPTEPEPHDTPQLITTDTPEKVPKNPNCSAKTVPNLPSPPRIVEPNETKAPARSGNPPEGSTAGSPPPRSHKSGIESLYASPSPGNAFTQLEPIELDSEPDFERMEQMLLSHRGSQLSQLVKKETSSQQPAPSNTPRPLKRQRSPSTKKDSQVPTQEPRTNSKRPRLKEPRSSDSAPVLIDRKKHPEFWDLDGTVVLQVDDVLFRVMRSALAKASPWFQRLFNEDFEHLEIMAGCPVYVIDEDISHLDFANLLSGLENGM